MKWIAWALAAALLAAVPAAAAGPEAAPVGKSAVVMEVSTGTVLYAQNEGERLRPASVTKIMTLLLIMEAVDAGVIALTDTVTASEAAAAKGGSQVYLKAGEQMSVSDMIKAIAVSSANDCACAMAEHLAGSEGAFVEQMNRRAAELGMENTHFVNCTGLDDGPDADQHLTSAYDIALMSRELLKNHPGIRDFTTIWMDTIRGGTFGLANTNKLIRFYPGATGLKTGYTAAAGYCLAASAEKEGMELIAVVMAAPTAKERNTACQQLLDYGFANYCLVRPSLEAVGPLPVKLGTEEGVSLALASQEGLLVEKAQAGQLRFQPELPEAVTAPVAAGQTLGQLAVYAGDTLVARLPLTAAEEVSRLTYWQIFARCLPTRQRLEANS